MTRWSEKECVDRLKALRWSATFSCPRCSGRRVRKHSGPDASGRRKYLCLGCGRIFNDLTGTPFAGSRLPLNMWFDCGKRMLRGEPTCAELSRGLGVKLGTAWRMRRRLRALMANNEFTRLLEEWS